MGRQGSHQRKRGKMDARQTSLTSRREILKAGGLIAGASMLAGFIPNDLFAGKQNTNSPQTSGNPPDQLAQMRAQMGAVPLQTLKLRDNIYLLYGPGGNMVALTGPAGKWLVHSGFCT